MAPFVRRPDGALNIREFLQQISGDRPGEIVGYEETEKPGGEKMAGSGRALRATPATLAGRLGDDGCSRGGLPDFAD